MKVSRGLIFVCWLASALMVHGAKVPELYQSLCASCHGKEMEGGLGSSLVYLGWIS